MQSGHRQRLAAPLGHRCWRDVPIDGLGRRAEGQAMRPLVRLAKSGLILVGGLSLLGGSETLACSGPGAARTMTKSFLIGWSLGGLACAIVLVGRKVLHGRGNRSQARWIGAPLAAHPALWMGVGHGDCGYGLRYWSLAATLWIAIAVALAICRPRSVASGPGKRRVVLGGALAGALVGLPLAALLNNDRPGVSSAMGLPLTGSFLFSPMLAGALIAGRRFRKPRN